MANDNICVIPARGGSKRLPRKNIIDFKGHPIISYTIQAALETQLFSRIIVSTEDPEIAEVSMKYGAEVIKRPKALAEDHASVLDVCLDLLESEKEAKREYKILCCLYATAPLRNVEDISKTFHLVDDNLCDFAMAVTEFRYSVHQSLKTNGKGFLEPVWPDLINSRRSDVNKIYVGNGSTYVVKVSEFVKQKTFYGKPLMGHLMPQERSIDIDYESDLKLANFYADLFFKK